MKLAEQVRAVRRLLLSYGQIQGDCHRAWVIDQALRILTGDRYSRVVAAYENPGDGYTYTWDTGIAP